MLSAPRASGIFPDSWPEGFSIPAQRTDDNRARLEAIISYPPVVTQEDIPDEVTNWFHVVKDEYREPVDNLIRMCQNVDREWDAVADEHVNLLRKQNDKVQTFAVKLAECDSLAQYASDDIKDNAVSLLFDGATAKKMVKLKRQITARTVLNKSMQATLGAALQEVKETKKVLVTTEYERCDL